MFIFEKPSIAKLIVYIRLDRQINFIPPLSLPYFWFHLLNLILLVQGLTVNKYKNWHSLLMPVRFALFPVIITLSKSEQNSCS